MQLIKDFTCSLANHNVSWLTIYKVAMLYLDDSVFGHVCAAEVNKPGSAAILAK